MGIKQLYNDNLRKIPNEYGDVSVMLLLVRAVHIYTWVTYMYLGSWMAACLGKSCSFGLPHVPFVNCCQFMCLVISLLVLRAGYGTWLYRFVFRMHNSYFRFLINRIYITNTIYMYMLWKDQFTEMYDFYKLVKLFLRNGTEHWKARWTSPWIQVTL